MILPLDAPKLDPLTPETMLMHCTNCDLPVRTKIRSAKFGFLTLWFDYRDYVRLSIIKGLDIPAHNYSYMNRRATRGNDNNLIICLILPFL